MTKVLCGESDAKHHPVAAEAATMRVIIGPMLFGGGVYLLAGQTQGSLGFWSGFALIALGLFSMARSKRRDGRHAPSRRRQGRRLGAGGGDGRSDPEGEGDGDGGGGDGGGGD